jgi:aspartate kinase
MNQSVDTAGAGTSLAPLVLKFGGSSFLELADYTEVARYVSDQAVGRQVVVVVSGMSGTTGRLLESALSIDPNLAPDVQDQLLATAEMVSAGFLRAALNAAGCSAIELYAPQLGITSDGNATRARICSIDPEPVRRAMAEHRVVVVAGGQATGPDGRITMLGRNSSDLTAVALAAALGLDRCEIFSDVPGVFTADPYLVPEARLLPELSYEQCAQMSRSGAKVLHGASVAVGQASGVAIVCRALHGRGTGQQLSATVGSTVGPQASPRACVVGDGKAQLYRLHRPAGSRHEFGTLLAQALATLDGHGFETVAVAFGDQTVLAFPGAQRGVAQAMAGTGLAAEPLSGFGLVSVVEPDGASERHLAPLTELDATVLRLHQHADRSNSADTQADTESVEFLLGGKRRSSYSSLLSGEPVPAC